MGERLDIKKMKEIAHDIIGEESKKNNISVNVFPLTFVEYFSGFEKREGRKFKLYDAVRYVKYRGYFKYNYNDIYICLKSPTNIVLVDNYYEFVKLCYHEFRHRMQDYFYKYSYEVFLKSMEDIIRTASSFDYDLKHDDYSFEIGANMYAVQKAKEYIKKKYPELYEKEKYYIDMMEQSYMIDYLSYDASDIVDRYIQAVRKIEARESKKHERVFTSKSDSTLGIFFNEDNTFKKVSEIINHDEFKLLDQRIVSAMFSCRTFLDGLDMDNLSLEELEVVSNALQYTSTIYKNQTNSLSKLNIRERDKLVICLEAEKSYIKKFIALAMYLDKILKRKINLSNSGSYRRQNAEYVSQQLEQSKKLIKQKNNRGFFVSDMFYIIGLLFTIFTVIYIIISKL